MGRPTYAPAANAATRHRARLGNLVLAGKRMPAAEKTVRAGGGGASLSAGAGLRSLRADGNRSVAARG